MYLDVLPIDPEREQRIREQRIREQQIREQQQYKEEMLRKQDEFDAWLKTKEGKKYLKQQQKIRRQNEKEELKRKKKEAKQKKHQSKHVGGKTYIGINGGATTNLSNTDYTTLKSDIAPYTGERDYGDNSPFFSSIFVVLAALFLCLSAAIAYRKKQA